MFHPLDEVKDVGSYWLNHWCGKMVLSFHSDGSDSESKRPENFNGRSRLILDWRDYGELGSEDNFHGRVPVFQILLHKYDNKINTLLNEGQKAARKRDSSEEVDLFDSIGQISLSSAPLSVWIRPQLKWMRVKVSVDTREVADNEHLVLLENH